MPIDDANEQQDRSVDSFDRRSTATAYHEAGHAVMACLVGRPVQSVTISPANIQTGGVRLGAVKIQKGRNKPTKDRLEDEVLILFSGMVCEAQFTGRYCESGARSDLIAIRRLLATRAGNEKQLEKLERRLLGKTEHVFSDLANEKAVEWVAKELIKKETISGRAVRHFLNQAQQLHSDG